MAGSFFGSILNRENKMKKLALAVAVLAFASTVHANQFMTKFNLDIPGNYSISNSGVTIDGNTNLGFGIGGEYYHPVNEQFTIGAGLEYQFGRKVSTMGGYTITDSNAFGFAPLYGTVLFFPEIDLSGYKAFLKLNLGYNLSFYGNNDFKGSDTLTGGFYYALGGGLDLSKNLRGEIMYGTYNGQEKTPSGFAIDCTYKKIGLSIGYLFDLKK